MRIAYRLTGYDRQTERLIGSHEIQTDLVSAARRIAQIPASDDGCGDYPLSTEQTYKLAKKLGITVHPETFDYLIEPYMKSPIFLTEREVTDEVRNMLRGPGPHRMAVAFWGDGADNVLGLGGDCPPIEIACNLSSGGTNPNAIRKILQVGRGHTVRSNPRLHAKMYLSGRSAIIGSSNASANGLALQGHELDGWLEANVFVDDAELVSEAHNWFDRIWNISVQVQLDDDLLKAADLAWRRARDRDRPAAGRKSGSLVDALRSRSRLVLSLPIRFEVELAYNPKTWANDEHKRILKDKTDDIHSESQGKDILFWENWLGALPGTYYVCYTANGKWDGIWKTPAVNHIRYLDKRRSITLCYKCKDIEGYAIPPADRPWLGNLLINRFRKTGQEDLSLTDVVDTLQAMAAE